MGIAIAHSIRKGHLRDCRLITCCSHKNAGAQKTAVMKGKHDFSKACHRKAICIFPASIQIKTSDYLKQADSKCGIRERCRTLNRHIISTFLNCPNSLVPVAANDHSSCVCTKNDPSNCSISSTKAIFVSNTSHE